MDAFKKMGRFLNIFRINNCANILNTDALNSV